MSGDYSDRRFAPGKIRDWKESAPETTETLESTARDLEKRAREVYDEDPNYAGALRWDAIRKRVSAFRLRYESSKIAVT